MSANLDIEILNLPVPDEIIYGAISGAIGAVATSVIPIYNKQPYHDSVFRGIDWMKELMAGHPERIRTELGVHLHVFHQLLQVLWKMGYSDLNHVFLEEQLSIFLYACVTSFINQASGGEIPMIK
jgi:hypothetical protein